MPSKDKNKEKSSAMKEEEKELIKENRSLEEKKDNSQSPQETVLSLEEIKKKASEYDALWDKYLRVCADFDNSRKRWEKERQEVVKFSNFKLIRDIIPIIDELEQAVKVVKKDTSLNKICEGIEITYKKLLGILNNYGVRSIRAEGEKFNPYLHEIVGQKEVEDNQEHTIVEEVQKGYLLEDKVLRASKVIVGVKKKHTTNSAKENPRR